MHKSHYKKFRDVALVCEDNRNSQTHEMILVAISRFQGEQQASTPSCGRWKGCPRGGKSTKWGPGSLLGWKWRVASCIFSPPSEDSHLEGWVLHGSCLCLVVVQEQRGEGVETREVSLARSLSCTWSLPCTWNRSSTASETRAPSWGPLAVFTWAWVYKYEYITSSCGGIPITVFRCLSPFEIETHISFETSVQADFSWNTFKNKKVL